MKQITPDQHLALSHTPFVRLQPKRGPMGLIRDAKKEVVMERIEMPRFVKPDEPQDQAIKRLMRSAKFVTKHSTATRRFPGFLPGKTTTAEYVRQFESMNNLRASGSAKHLTSPAPVNEGPEVIFETEEDECLDLL